MKESLRNWEATGEHDVNEIKNIGMLLLPLFYIEALLHIIFVPSQVLCKCEYLMVPFKVLCQWKVDKVWTKYSELAFANGTSRFTYKCRLQSPADRVQGLSKFRWIRGEGLQHPIPFHLQL
ncbi:hypothetical protein BCR41DRAFT_373518 [Lobosporangium transversale]|uniref:Uncharacterized protein n=1 Tax=Lobosporangium transversale TaxID=64571 RepID=A0A1Y2GFP1_9FUNG|nr:hypothetical protein BCR41DRAFT_373518 [Lobosporangium transversale]ORZ07765.1 hypothetical protein BCR41DRAFT_373518 [Lobosporangium transversale]|eukprot:XP_021878131.1 hypothetical protein BCR41DRAFT_373518 [Lobosporangium transversale]